MSFDEEHKKKIEEQLVQQIISALEQEKIDSPTSSIISGYILDNIDTIQTQQDLHLFLLDLSTRWPFFSTIYELEKGQEQEAHKDEKIADIQNMLKSGNIEEALTIAKSATE